jgi:lauroyl/myristoyl acyltransferase
MPALAALPRALGYRIARSQGRHLARVNSRHCAAARRSIEQTRGIAEDPQSIAERTFETLAFEDLDTYYFPFWNRTNIGRYFSFDGLEHLEAALLQGKGALLFTAHFGSVCAPVVAFGLRGYPLHHLTRHSPGERDFDWTFRQYARLKTGWMSKAIGRDLVFIQSAGGKYASETSASAVLQALRLLRENRLVSLAVDVPRALVASTEEVDFLGRRCRFPAGLLDLAYLSEAPVMSYFAVRDTNRPYLQTVSVSSPLVLARNRRADLQTVLDSFAEVLTRRPEQWFCWDSLDAFAA